MATRRAVGFTQFGGPEVLRVVELPLSGPDPGEVTIQVRAAAVNPTDTGLRSGRRFSPEWPPPYVPGMEAAGTVVAAGEGAGVAVGDRVMAVVNPRRPEGGAYTEYLTVPAAQVIDVPDGASLEQAATLPMNGLTAKIALDVLDLRPGQTLGVTGAAGVLGGYAIALAVRQGLHVVADARAEDEGLVRSFGAHDIVARGPGVGERMRDITGGGVDGLLDGAVQGDEVVAGVRDGGAIAAVRAFHGEAGRDIEVHQVQVARHLDDRVGLALLRDLAGTGEIALRVAGTYAPQDTADAHRRFEQGGVRGRLLILF